MNLKVINKTPENTTIGYIGKTGVLRIKERDTQKLGISKAQKWLFCLDLDETAFKKYIYLIKAESDGFNNSKKMTANNGSYFIDVNILLSELKLKVPIRCAIEAFNESDYNGLRVKIA